MQRLCVKVSLALTLLVASSACVGQGYGDGEELDVAVEDPSTMDRDRDNVLDANDLCPDDPEDFDNFQDDDGCPESDNDQDGIPDIDDKCPNEPEVFNGYQDDDGCPDAPPRSYPPSYTRVEIRQKAYFNEGEDTFAPGTRAILDELAIVLNKHPEFERIRIGGHTDARGSASYNQTVGLKHANIVRDYLIGQGVDGDRLIVKSYGEEVPLCDVGSIEPGDRESRRECRARNRRVEFEILDQPID